MRFLINPANKYISIQGGGGDRHPENHQTEFHPVFPFSRGASIAAMYIFIAPTYTTTYN
jgi:hypothetical protein